MESNETRGCVAGNRETAAGHVEEVVRQVREELQELYIHRAEVQRRIGTLKRTMTGLDALFGATTLHEQSVVLKSGKRSERKPGFTQACRSVLRRADRALRAGEVHDQLQRESPALLSALKQPMTAVTTVLNRLADYGEARRISLNNGRRAWQWAEADNMSAGSDKDVRSLVPVALSDGSTALSEDAHPSSLP